MGHNVAIVTGANSGIGFYVAIQLLQQFQGDVVVTASNPTKGEEACKALEAEGLKPIWHELDVTQSASVRMLLDFIRDKYGGIDVLVSNAGVICPKDSPLTMYGQAELSIQTSFKGTLSLCKHFIPLLRPHSRIVILSSELGKLSSLGPELRAKVNPDKITIYELENLADQYLAAVKSEVWTKYGWPDRILETVSVFQNVLAYVLARDLKDDERRNILVNAGCPGWTSTDEMKTYLDETGCLGGTPARDAEEAAADIVWLALLPSGTKSPNGDAVQFQKPINFRT